MSRGLLAAWLVGATAVCGAIADQVKTSVKSSENTESLNLHETNTAASLFGQVRVSATSWLWLHTDLYLHQGVEMRPRTEEEAGRGLRSDSSSDGLDAALHGNLGVVTTIPDRAHDFRGVFGDIEREMTAYRSMRDHQHENPEKTFPLFRLMTWIDPTFVPGWTVGASVIGSGRHPQAATRALSFLQNGLKENPRSIAILSELGATIITRTKQLDEALPYLERAIALHSGPVSALQEDDADGLQNAYRWLSISYRDLGQTKNVERVTRLGLSIFPEDGVLKRVRQGRTVMPVEQEPHDHDHEHDHEH